MLTKQDVIGVAEFVDNAATDAAVYEAVELLSHANEAEVIGPFLADPNDQHAGLSHNEAVIGLCLAAAALE